MIFYQIIKEALHKIGNYYLYYTVFLINMVSSPILRATFKVFHTLIITQLWFLLLVFMSFVIFMIFKSINNYRSCHCYFLASLPSLRITNESMHVVTKALSFSFFPWTDNIKIQALQYSWPFHPCDKERVRNKRMTCTNKSNAYSQGSLLFKREII